MNKIGIIDYGMGNLLSLQRALIHIGCDSKLINYPDEILNFDRLILPGVGAFPDGMASIKNKEFFEPIIEFSKSGKPFLGICLGMQMMLSNGKEFKNTDGLSLIDGEVLPLPKNLPNCKVPNINWHQIYSKENLNWNGSILKNTENKTNFYFVHSFYAQTLKPENTLAYSNFGEFSFAAVINKDNLFGTQFHPEKSGNDGLKLLETFINF